MIAIMIGMPALILVIALVLGLPIFYYSKRDRAYMLAEGQPQHVKNKIWYGE